MLLGQRLDSLPGVAVAQILGLRARLAFPCVALPPLTPGAAARAAPVPGSCPRSSDAPRRRPCYLWPPRRMPHGPVRRFWPRGPFGLRGPTIPWRASGCALAAGRPADLKRTSGRQGRAALRPPAGAAGPIRFARARHAAGCPRRGGPTKTGEAAPARHAPRSPATTFWPHAASSGAACSP